MSWGWEAWRLAREEHPQQSASSPPITLRLCVSAVHSTSSPSMLKQIVKPFASLYLTVTLLALSLVLIYAGTWAHVDVGIWGVQKKYFHAFFVWVPFQTLFPRPGPGQAAIPFGFPMLGGYTLGALLLINLLAAHITRFKFSFKDLLL